MATRFGWSPLEVRINEMTKTSKTIGAIPFVALLLAWLIPGSGHVYIGRVRRGIIIFIAIGGAFWAGVGMGGVLTVDYHHERWWFIADMFTGVHGIVSGLRQQRVYQDLAKEAADEGLAVPGVLPPDPVIQKKLAEKGLFPQTATASVARVYAGVAGLLNLMCIFDAFVLTMMGQAREPRPSREQAP